MAIVILLLFGVVFAPQSHRGNPEEPSVRQAFSAFYMSLAPSLHKHYAVGDCTYEFIYDQGQGRKQQTKVHATFSASNYVLRNSTTFIDPTGNSASRRDGRRLIEGLNSRYSFVIRENSDGSFVLINVTMRRSERIPLLPISFPVADITSGIFYSDLPHMDDVSFVSFSRGSFGGIESYELIVDIPYPVEGSDRPIWARHCFFFEPERGYCLGSRAFAGRTTSGAFQEERAEYQLLGEAFALKRITRWSYSGNKDAPPKVILTTDIHNFVRRGSIPIQEFTLSAFGFEEPHGVTWPKPTPYWLYGTLGSSAVIVLGILLMRWAQRRAAKAAG